MEITSTFHAPALQLSLTGPTVVAPGESLLIILSIQAEKNCHLTTLQLDLPEAVQAKSNAIEIMQSLTEGQSLEKQIHLQTWNQQEGFGEIRYNLHYRLPDDPEEKFEFTSWISVFERQLAAATGLSDPLRERLVNVVNFRKRNGHIFLADFVSFFDDFLNIEIPDRIAGILAEEFALPDEGLPVDLEKYIAIINGEFSFYGIEQLELIYEEDCNESDDKFDMSEAAEVSNPLV